MGFALALRELSTHRRLLAVGAVVAVLAATLSVYRLDGFGLKSRSLQYSAASTQVLVDSDSSALGNLTESFESLANRAVVYADFMTNPSVLSLIGQQVGLQGGQIYAVGPVTGATRIEQEPTALKRNVEITGETKPYRLNFESQNNLPTITINAQAPNTKQAVALANAAALVMHRYVEEDVSVGTIAPPSRVVIRQLGTANGAVVDGGISKQLFVIVFVLVFALWCVGMLAVPRFLALWRESAVAHTGTADPGPQVDDSAGDRGTPEVEPPGFHIVEDDSDFADIVERNGDFADIVEHNGDFAEIIDQPPPKKGKRSVRAVEDAEVASATGPAQ